MRVDVTLYRQEQVRSVIDTETVRADRGRAHHGALLHHSTRRHQRRQAASGQGARMPPALCYFLPPGLSPLTRALKSAPGRNFGTEDAGTWTIWLVAGAIYLLYQPIKLWLFSGR